MLDYQGRVVKERDQLSEKIDKLRTFTNSAVYVTLPYKERGRLTRQYLAMATYLDILNERIAAFEASDAA
jgi:hypothetical protein